MTHYLLEVTLSLLAGGMIGLMYFSGLWRTVQRLTVSARPYRLVAVSFVGRLILALGGFYLLMDGSWERLAAALGGFILVRAIMVKVLGRVPALPLKGAAAWK